MNPQQKNITPKTKAIDVIILINLLSSFLIGVSPVSASSAKLAI